MREECESLLRKLTRKEYIIFTKRCNASILASLKLAKHLGYKKVFIPDQGGWITYYQYAKKLKMQESRIRTSDGLFDSFQEKDSVLLFHSMPAYSALADSRKLYLSCKKNNSLMINDVCGSIGTKSAFYGDIVVCSFGRWKPLNVGSGGFIATDKKEFYDFLKKFSSDVNFEHLHGKLASLNERLLFLRGKAGTIKKDLPDFDIVHRKSEGLNVIVRFSSDSEKERLIKYCNEHSYEFVECPKYIRVLDKAISIEVKRC